MNTLFNKFKVLGIISTVLGIIGIAGLFFAITDASSNYCGSYGCVIPNNCSSQVMSARGDTYYQDLRLNIPSNNTITKYKIQRFNGARSDWYIVGQGDLDRKTNNDGTPRRIWSYFADHTYQIDTCNSQPNYGSKDLTIDSMYTLPAELYVNQNNSYINVRVKNTGTESINQNVKFVCINQYDNSSFTFSRYVSLQAGGSQRYSEGPSFRSTFLTTSGNKSIKCTVDSDNSISEINENNNSAVLGINVNGNSQPNYQYNNLSIQSMNIERINTNNPAQPFVGGNYKLVLNVYNAFPVGGYYQPIVNTTIGIKCNVGSSNFTVYRTININTPNSSLITIDNEFRNYFLNSAGYKTVTCNVDSTNVVAETNEYDNSRSLGFTVSQNSTNYGNNNLSMSSFSFNPNSVNQYNNAPSFTIGIKNNSSNWINSNNVTISCTRFNGVVGSKIVAINLAPNGISYVTFGPNNNSDLWNTMMNGSTNSLGVKNYTCSVNDNNSIDSNTYDNSKNASFNVTNNGQNQGGTDLQLVNLAVNPTAPGVGNATSLNIVVKNNTNGNFNGNVQVSCDIDTNSTSVGNLNTTSFYVNLNAGATTTLTINSIQNMNYMTYAGQKVITCRVDSNNQYAESNESNNYSSITFTVYGQTYNNDKPDLIMSNIDVTSASQSSNSVRFNMSIKNMGGAIGSYDPLFYISCYTDGNVNGYNSITTTSYTIPKPFGTNQTFTFQGNQQLSFNPSLFGVYGAGMKTLTCAVDRNPDLSRNNVINESNENNNTFSIQYYLQP